MPSPRPAPEGLRPPQALPQAPQPPAADPAQAGVRPGPALTACAAGGIGCALLLLVAGMEVAEVGQVMAGALAVLAGVAAGDGWHVRRRWRRGAPRLTRRLPAAFALGAVSEVQVTLAADAGESWGPLELHDGADPSLATRGLPARVAVVEAGRSLTLTYQVVPERRGEVGFAPAQLRVRSRLGLLELLVRAGPSESRRVYPDFAQVARHAWLAGHQRLAQIGIKSWQRRGEGTDFKQLAEYRIGDAVRHIDWKATLRSDRPIIREYQDERDQNVILMIDCGRRMRAHEGQAGTGRTHFDQVLNAAVLLAYVALRHGDAVGAMTFATPAGEERLLRPRKGAGALNELMAGLYDVQPALTHPDYVAAARALLTRQTKRSLVVVLTNFRDEDSSEIAAALALLRSRHLVLLASLRERIVREIAAQPLNSSQALVEVASAHLHAQARKDAFRRLAARDALMLDADPADLAVELVNRYQAVKRAGLI